MERIVDYKNNCTLVAIKEITGRSSAACWGLAAWHSGPALLAGYDVGR